ncbi:MAG: thioredoxin [Lachnospiraceae bacterium]|nr:thioredoxin [Lachnospiraceae bacterium]
MAELTLTSGNFEEEVIKSDIPVLVDFWAPWCNPCKMMGPVVAKLAGELEGRVKVGKVNVDEEGDLAARYGVQSIPMFAYFKNGEIVAKKIGGTTIGDLKSMLV